MGGKKADRIFAGVMAAILVVFGFFIAVYPSRSLDALFIGALLVAAAFSFQRFVTSEPRSILQLVTGALSMLAALIVLLNVLGIFDWDAAMITIPVWGVVYGALQLATGYDLAHKGSYSGGWLAGTGILSMLAGVIMLVFPLFGWLTMTDFVGILLGILMVVAGVNALNDAFV